MQLLKQLSFFDHFMGGYNEGVYAIVGSNYLLLIILWEDITKVCMQLLKQLLFVDHFMGGYN